jgi:acyl carrier protein
MNPERETVKDEIRAKLKELAAGLDYADADFADDDLIPATGLLDSASILDLVVWYENHYGLTLKQDEINIDNLGSINAMAEYLSSHKKA